VAKVQIFDDMPLKIAKFISACKLYVRMNLKEESVERQMQWILSYV